MDQPNTWPPDSGVATDVVTKINRLSMTDKTKRPMVAGLNSFPEVNAAKPPAAKRIVASRK